MKLVSSNDNNPIKRLLSVWIVFSDGNVTVNDEAHPFVIFKTGQEHGDQGFARTASQVMFMAQLEFGHALLTAYLGPYQPDKTHERVVEVPLRADSGRILMCGGPDDLPGRSVKISPGDYRLVCAQSMIGGERDPDPKKSNRIAIDLYFEPVAEALKSSRILVADKDLDPPSPLLETVEVVASPPWMRR